MAKIVQWLIPKEDKFYDMLTSQSSNVAEASRDFDKLVSSYASLSEKEVEQMVVRIKDLEHKGDKITHDLMDKLDTTFITPIDKEDIHRLAVLLDDIIDLIYATAKRIQMFKIKSIDTYIKEFSAIVLQIVGKIDTGIREMGKSGDLNHFYIDVHTLENQGDEIFYNALEHLFEKDIVDVIKFKEIYEYLENIIDKCEDTAIVIQNVVVKHA